jgi:hypothetical protein
MMDPDQLSEGRSRAELIASYAYGQTAFTTWGEPLDAYADVSKEERENSKTMEGGSYPINKCTGKGPSVESAVHAVGRGKGDHDAIRKHIIEASNDLKCAETLIPDNWKSDGTVDESKTAAKLAGAPPVEPGVGAGEDDDEEEAEGSADHAVMNAIDQAIEAQEADPDTADPNDAKVLDLLKQAKAAQEADQGGEAKPDKAPAKLAVAPPEADQACVNPECKHPASIHENTSDGENKGACGTPGCKCPAMNTGADPDEEGGPAESAGDPNAQLAAGPPAPGASPTAEPEADPTLNEPPPMEGGENMGPAFTIPVGIIEGQPTGDGRQIAPDALTWRVPPLPLMGLKTETHDPMGLDMNDPAVLCGRIDAVSRAPGEGSTQVITAHGYYLPNDDGLYFAGVTEAFGRCGISADVATQSTEITITEMDEHGIPLDELMTVTEGAIMGFTQVPFAAFEGAYIVLGDGTDAAEAKIPQQSEEMQGVTAAAPIHWMSFSECEPCDHGMEVITASGAGPTRPPKAWFEDPCFTVGDDRLREIVGSAGETKYACPLTVTPEGRVFGHIAPWNVCHTGIPGKCVVAPRGSDYRHFMRGQHLTTAEGDHVAVGVITADTAHAAMQLSAAAAMVHYENTGLSAADVAAGEDDYGIWVAGAVRPNATEIQIRNLTASSPSGDWRQVNGRLELVAALAVPLPGFPLVVVDHDRGVRASMVATGASVMHALKNPASEGAPDPGLMWKALGPLAKRQAADRLAALR